VSKRQTITARSMTEAKIYATDECTKCLLHLHQNILLFGSNLSVWKKAHEKPVMIVGQDQCIFKQYTLNRKSWTCTDGTCALLPKDDGQGIMVSAFNCREFGFGEKFTKSMLKEEKEEGRTMSMRFQLNKKYYIKEETTH
jgi:hypothetical protein